MKKTIFTILICALMILSLAGCDNKDDKKLSDETPVKEEVKNEEQENKEEQKENENKVENKVEETPATTKPATTQTTPSTKPVQSTQPTQPSQQTTPKEPEKTCTKKKFTNKYSYVYETKDACLKNGNQLFLDLTDNGLNAFTYRCEEIVDECGDKYFGVYFNTYNTEK